MYFKIPAKKLENYIFDYQMFVWSVKKWFAVLLFIFISYSNRAASAADSSEIITRMDTCSMPDSLLVYFPDSLTAQPKRPRLAAAILSFPFPFGIVGGHRLYFGTKPYMPFVYIATLGGCFGILPLIDFIAILTSSKKNFERFKNNPKIFMWLK